MSERITWLGEIPLRELAVSCNLERPYRYDEEEQDVFARFKVEDEITLSGVEIKRKHTEDLIDYEDIDIGIRELIRNMNELSFLSTTVCCEGHLPAIDPSGEVLPDNRKRLWGGWVGFVFDPRLSETETFFQRLEEILEDFSFVEVYFLSSPLISEVGMSHPSDYCYGLPYCLLSFDLSDFSDSEDYIPANRGVVVDRRVGEERLGLYKQFWGGLLELAQKFI